MPDTGTVKPTPWEIFVGLVALAGMVEWRKHRGR
jgi:hypothetical protein